MTKRKQYDDDDDEVDEPLDDDDGYPGDDDDDDIFSVQNGGPPEIDPDGDNDPPFDFFHRLPEHLDYQKTMREVEAVDSTVERAFKGTHVDREVVRDIDRYFKLKWFKHHG